MLSGPPDSVTMKAGLVVLALRNQSENTALIKHEEILVVLKGRGEMIFKNKPPLPVEANHAVYCPPQTEHDVKNTGTRCAALCPRCGRCEVTTGFG